MIIDHARLPSYTEPPRVPLHVPADIPVANLAPLDYRYALDAAFSILRTSISSPEDPGRKSLGRVHVLCNIPELEDEVRQRLPGGTALYESENRRDVDGFLWIEPLVYTWETDLLTVSRNAPIGARVVIIASQPLACILPERWTWRRLPLGVTVGGMRRILKGIDHADIQLEARYGLHSPKSIAVSTVSQISNQFGRAALADRLRSLAQLNYNVSGWSAALATVALLSARRTT